MRFLLLFALALLLLAARGAEHRPNFRRLYNRELGKAMVQVSEFDEQNKNLAEKLEAARAKLSKLRELEPANVCPEGKPAQ